MKKKVSLQERVNKEKKSANKFEQGFKTGSVTMASVASPKKIALTDEQSDKIKGLFTDYKPDDVAAGDVGDDLHRILELSTMIKSITQHSVLLIGERIKKAQTLMANYRGGMFNKWLFMVFGNKVTPYSFLNYHNLYHSIEDPETRNSLEEMPKKAAYKLASRKGELGAKIEILKSVAVSKEKTGNMKAAALEKIIDLRLPVSALDSRSVGNTKRNPVKAKNIVIEYMCNIIGFKKVLSGGYFSDQEKEVLGEVSELLRDWGSQT